jgi:hypothetical protein
LVLLVLAPVVVNIVLYQVFLDQNWIGIVLGALLAILEGGLAYLYRDAFLALLHIRPDPS